MHTDKPNRLFGIFILAAMLFNYPILGLWDNKLLWGFMPLIYVYFFVAWLLLIIATFLIIEFPRHKR